MRSRLVLLFLVVSVISIGFVYADVPSVNDVQIEAAASGYNLNVTIRHGRPSDNHYVAKVEVDIGEDVLVFNLLPQETDYFTEIFDIPETDEIMVRAFCTQHGWGQWISYSIETGDPMPEEPSDEGIPGFPLVSLGVGLILYSLIRRLEPTSG